MSYPVILAHAIVSFDEVLNISFHDDDAPDHGWSEADDVLRASLRPPLRAESGNSICRLRTPGPAAPLRRDLARERPRDASMLTQRARKRRWECGSVFDRELECAARQRLQTIKP